MSSSARKFTVSASTRATSKPSRAYFQENPAPTIHLEADASISRGGGGLESAQGELDGRIETQLSEIEYGWPIADMTVPDIRQTLQALRSQVENSPTVRCSGVVTEVVGAIIESQGPAVGLGDVCEVETGDGDWVRVQVVGFRGNRVLSMPLDELGPLQPAAASWLAVRIAKPRRVRKFLGRVLDGLGRPSDGAGPLRASRFRDLYAAPPGPARAGSHF